MNSALEEGIEQAELRALKAEAEVMRLLSKQGGSMNPRGRDKTSAQEEGPEDSAQGMTGKWRSGYVCFVDPAANGDIVSSVQGRKLRLRS